MNNSQDGKAKQIPQIIKFWMEHPFYQKEL
jgi:hypothetical protein